MLDPGQADLVVRLYNVEEEGNFEEEATRQRTGENILFLRRPLDEYAAERGPDGAETAERLAEAWRRLFAHRERRVHPGKDDKVLADWNGLMIAALARAARIFRDDAFAEAARRAAGFVLTAMRRGDGGLLHRYRNGEAAIPGNLDDYAFFVWGLLELYETTFDAAYLEAAVTLNEYTLAHFWDDEHGAFFFAPDDGEALIVRQKEAYDGAVPSGNSVAMFNLLRLSRLTGNTGLEQQAGEVGAFFAGAVRQQPAAFTAMLTALDFAVGPSFEVVVAGDPAAADTEAMLAALQAVYVPNKVVLLRPADEDRPDIARLAPYTWAQHALGGRATAYVCRNFACELPTTDVAQMLALLQPNAKE